MKHIKLTLALILLSFAPAFAQTFSADAILGTWLTGSQKAAVTVYKEGGKYFGKISWLKNPNDENGKAKVDKNNPDDKKKTVPLMGLNLLKDFVFGGTDKWEKGTIYDPENGKTYSCKITMITNDKLDVRGFVGISMLGRTQTWIRIPDKK
jgi:uncharacterized protein (DUF2147 family)